MFLLNSFGNMVGTQISNGLVYQSFVYAFKIRVGPNWILSSVLDRCFITGMIGSGNYQAKGCNSVEPVFNDNNN